MRKLLRNLLGLLGGMAGMYLANSHVLSFSFELNYVLTLCFGGLIGALLLDNDLPTNSSKFLALVWYPGYALAMLFTSTMAFVLAILLCLSLIGDLSFVNDENMATYFLFVLAGGLGSGFGFLLFTLPFGIQVTKPKVLPLEPTPKEYKTKSGDF